MLGTFISNYSCGHLCGVNEKKTERLILSLFQCILINPARCCRGGTFRIAYDLCDTIHTVRAEGDIYPLGFLLSSNVNFGHFLHVCCDNTIERVLCQRQFTHIRRILFVLRGWLICSSLFDKKVKITLFYSVVSAWPSIARSSSWCMLRI